MSYEQHQSIEQTHFNSHFPGEPGFISPSFSSTGGKHLQSDSLVLKYRRETCYTRTHTHPFNGPFSRTAWVSRYQKGKTNLHFTEARDSEWQWRQLGHMHVCTSLQTDNHASTPPLSFLQAGCPSCHPTTGIKALKGNLLTL